MARVFTITEGLENMGALKTGGQGSVYKGRRKGEIITAVKLLPTPIHTEDPNDKSYRDFTNEVNKLKKVNLEPNPNVVKILNSGITETGFFPFIEMEFIEGPDLEELLQPPHDPVFTIKEVIRVAEHLSNALAHCHKLDVKHGDVKSNNVKFNKHTGNYIILDFGLAALSDEQRRTSLRHAGAVEFMAPEQTDGDLLFQSDIYSFGIILYELLAGVVPFPAGDKSETSRTKVLMAHRETTPPDLLPLRREHLPESWSDSKKQREANVPEWILNMVYKCLEKDPRKRFLNGTDLHEYIVHNSTLPVEYTGKGAEQLISLKKKNVELQRENERLQKALLKLNDQLEKNQKQWDKQQLETASGYRYYSDRKRGSGGTWLAALLTIIILGSISYFVLKGFNKAETTTSANTENADQPQEAPTLTEYRVAAARAYFHNEPDVTTRRAANIPEGGLIQASQESNGFVYTEFTNSRGQTSKGWLRKADLMLPEEWERQQQLKRLPPEVLYKDELSEAAGYLQTFDIAKALSIYRPLVEKEVPEAMYHYGDLALKDLNPSVDCRGAMSLINKASDKGYLPAKTTLGFLHIFAENPDVLQSGRYTRCTFQKDVEKGVRLLEQSAAGGNEAARQILEQYRNMQSAGTAQ